MFEDNLLSELINLRRDYGFILMADTVQVDYFQLASPFVLALLYYLVEDRNACFLRAAFGNIRMVSDDYLERYFWLNLWKRLGHHFEAILAIIGNIA